MQITPEGVPYADTSDAMSIADITAAMATGISEQLAKLASAGIVANQAERDALYPNPIQGNTVFRQDYGRRETYFGLYNASTNPGGMAVAGWVVEGKDWVVNPSTPPANPRINDTLSW